MSKPLPEVVVKRSRPAGESRQRSVVAHGENGLLGIARHRLHHHPELFDGVAMGRLPAQAFILFGQMGRADPTRSPAGTETAWAYTHVPNPVAKPDAVRWDDGTAAAVVERIEHEVERRAPGFRDTVIGRHVMVPAAFEALDPCLERARAC